MVRRGRSTNYSYERERSAKRRKRRSRRRDEKRKTNTREKGRSKRSKYDVTMTNDDVSDALNRLKRALDKLLDDAKKGKSPEAIQDVKDATGKSRSEGEEKFPRTFC